MGRLAFGGDRRDIFNLGSEPNWKSRDPSVPSCAQHGIVQLLFSSIEQTAPLTLLLLLLIFLINDVYDRQACPTSFGCWLSNHGKREGLELTWKLWNSNAATAKTRLELIGGWGSQPAILISTRLSSSWGGSSAAGHKTR